MSVFLIVFVAFILIVGGVCFTVLPWHAGTTLNFNHAFNHPLSTFKALFDELQVTSVKLKLQIQAKVKKMAKSKPSESTNDDPDVQITGSSTSSPAQPADLVQTFVNAAALHRSQLHANKVRSRLD